jgi:hypothetical protein
MEALGIISTIYNQLEFKLYMLIAVYSQLEPGVAKSLFEKMSNFQRLQFLLDCSNSRIKDNQMHEHVANFIDCYDIVAGNRNTVMHSMIMTTDDEGILSFWKPSRAKPMIDRVLFLDISLLRRTALDLQDVDVYGTYIFLWCNNRAPWSKHYLGEKEVKGAVPPSAKFLKKLALPSKLSISGSQTPKSTEAPA